jgi:hypothetical protein
MEKEIHHLLVEVLKRFSNQRTFLMKYYFAGNQYNYSDIEQDFYLKLFTSLTEDHSKIERIIDENYFFRCFQNYILDSLKKEKKDNLFVDFEENYLIEKKMLQYVQTEDPHELFIEIQLSNLISDCNFSPTEITLITEHYFYDVKYTVLNKRFQHSNTQQKIARMILILQKKVEEIQNLYPDYTIIIINDLND